jgi:uncharacterized protein
MPDQTTGKYEKMLRDAGCSPKVIAHCRAVRDCACEYAQANPSVDFSLVEQGALLHDIGRGSTHSIVCHADNLCAGARRMSIEQSISSVSHLPHKVRERMYRLATEVELLCK